MDLALDKIEIYNYKSVYRTDLFFNKNSNNTYIFVGKNGTGKSKLLEAITRSNYLNSYNYKNVCTKKHQSNNEPVIIKYICNIENERKAYINEIKQKLKAPISFWKNLKINSITKTYTLIKNSSNFEQKIEYNLNDILYDKYCYRQIPQAEITEEEPQIYEIIKYFEDIDTMVYKKLTKNFIENTLLSNIFKFNIDSALWTPEDNNILQESIDLYQFRDNPNINIPMKNIFYISGYKSIQEIRTIINEIGNDEIQIETLETKLSDDTNEFINKIWKDENLKTKLKFKISKNQANQYKIITTVTSDNEKHGIYSMEDVSDGFKQFISILLSFNIRKNYNNIIAIDEPEVHLHPSAAMYLKEQLLKLGNKNYVFYSTHSPFMLDATNSQRHYKVKKEDSITDIIQLPPNTNINDDELTEELFGINTLRDFYAPNRMLVEGQSEKTIIDYGLKLLNKNQCIVITNGKGDNTVQVASYINTKKVNNVLTILDSDSVGMQNKNFIKSIGGIYNDKNVFCIKDIIPSLPDFATIEDLLDPKYVAMIFNNYIKELGYGKLQSFIPNTTAILTQIHAYCSINHIDWNKDNIKELKTRIAENFEIKSGALKTKNIKLNELLTFIIKYFEGVNNI